MNLFIHCYLLLRFIATILLKTSKVKPIQGKRKRRTRNVRHKGANTSPQGPSTPPQGGNNPTLIALLLVILLLLQALILIKKKREILRIYFMTCMVSIRLKKLIPATQKLALVIAWSVLQSLFLIARKWSDDLFDDYPWEITSTKHIFG